MNKWWMSERLGYFADCLHTDSALAGSESDLWVGTLDRGVLHFHAGQTDSFAEPQGLPDRQVASVAISDDTTYIGTPLGVAVFSAGRFSRVLAPGVLATALLVTHNQLYVGSEDQSVIAIPLEGRHPNSDVGRDSQLSEVRQIFTSGDVVFALARYFEHASEAVKLNPVTKLLSRSAAAH